MDAQVIGPILLQRTCDGGKDKMPPEEWARLIAERLKGNPVGFMGCGTIFQWWWDGNCRCPGCGRTFSITLEDMKRYRVSNPAPPRYDREMEDRILRNVLARLGR